MAPRVNRRERMLAWLPDGSAGMGLGATLGATRTNDFSFFRIYVNSRPE
jgi:hypothetical protein